MIERLERFTVRWGHARARTLSRYLEGDLGQSERLSLEAHLRDCPDCREHLKSLTSTLEALRSMRPSARPDLADSIIAALRAKAPARESEPGLSVKRVGSPVLTLVSNQGPDGIERASVGPARWAGWRRMPQALLGYCLRRPQLRLTLPLALLAGVALSVINQGSMIFGGRAKVLEVCVQCAPNFVIPFVALNVGLLLAARAARRRRL